MKKTNKLLFLFTLAVLPLCATSCSPTETPAFSKFKLSHKSSEFLGSTINESKKIKNIICFIGDGMGVNQVDVGSIYFGKPMCFADENDKNWTYHALVNTDSLTSVGFTLDETKSLIHPDENSTLYDGTPSPYGTNPSTENITPYTDSAAGGTAISTGQKVTNSRIAKDIKGNDIETIAEIAHRLGKKTGVVTSDYITGATPSAFFSHATNRYQAEEILNRAATSGVDYIAGEKPSEWSSSFESKYSSNGYKVGYNFDSISLNDKKITLLPDDVTPLDDKRYPTLTELTQFGLEYLDNSENGFFMMVEGAKIDKACHANNPYYMMRELEGFNNAVYEAQKWASLRNDTLILVTADHECGGLYYPYATATQETILDSIGYKSYNHSRARVRLDVFGDISEFTSKYADEFLELENKPYWDNTYTFNLMCSYL